MSKLSHCRSTMSQLFPLLFIVVCASGEPNANLSTTGSSLTNEWAPRSLYKHLKGDCEVYACLVQSIQPLPTLRSSERNEPSDFQLSEVRLKVVETIRGRKREILVLPLSKQIENFKGVPKSPYPWPLGVLDSPKMPVCVVIDVGENSNVPGISHIDGVAKAAFLGVNSADKFWWMRELCEIADTQQVRGINNIEVLREMTTDWNSEFRRYAVDALVYEYMYNYPDSVRKALEVQFGRCVEIGMDKSGEASSQIRGFVTLAGSPTATKSVRQTAAKILIEYIIIAPDSDLEYEAIDELSLVVSPVSLRTPHGSVSRSGAGNGLPFNSAETLSCSEIAEAKTKLLQVDAIDPNGAHHPAIAAIFGWLR